MRFFLQGFAKLYGGGGVGEGGVAPGEGVRQPSHPPLFIGEGKRGPAPSDPIYKGAATKGGNLPPSMWEASPPLGFPTLGADGP